MKTSHEKIEIWAYKTVEKSVFISPKTKQAHVTGKFRFGMRRNCRGVAQHHQLKEPTI